MFTKDGSGPSPPSGAPPRPSSSVKGRPGSPATGPAGTRWWKCPAPSPARSACGVGASPLRLMEPMRTLASSSSPTDGTPLGNRPARFLAGHSGNDVSGSSCSSPIDRPRPTGVSSNISCAVRGRPLLAGEGEGAASGRTASDPPAACPRNCVRDGRLELFPSCPSARAVLATTRRVSGLSDCCGSSARSLRCACAA